MKHNTIIFFALLVSQVIQIQAKVQWTGVNLAGAEFDGGSYWPKNADVDYYSSKGMNVIRVPFGWERLQPTLGGDFASAYSNSLSSVVSYATGKGVYVLLDVHNYARFNGDAIGAVVSNEDFADLWTRLANQYKSNDKVLFGLMNEPKSMPSLDWRDGAQAAVDAIRATGATNFIFLPGNGFTGAWSWFQGFYDQAAVHPQSNAQLMPSVWDPLNKMIYEVHQYFDGDSSGISDICRNPPVGNSTLDAITFWLKENNKRAFLGEFGVSTNANCLKALEDAVRYMDDNSDVWLGWTYWAGGTAWGGYPFSIQPTSDYTVDKPQMAVLQPFLHGLDPVSITMPPPNPTCINQTIFDDRLRNGWQSWSWAAVKNFSDTSLAYSGSQSISFIPQDYGAISLSLDLATFSTSLYSGVEFYINGAPNGGQNIRFGYRKNKADYGSPKQVNVNNFLETGTEISNQWTRVYVPFSAHGIQPDDGLQSVNIASNTAAAQERVYIDSISLVCIQQATPPSFSNQPSTGQTPSSTPGSSNQPSSTQGPSSSQGPSSTVASSAGGLSVGFGLFLAWIAVI